MLSKLAIIGLIVPLLFLLYMILCFYHLREKLFFTEVILLGTSNLGEGGKYLFM